MVFHTPPCLFFGRRRPSPTVALGKPVSRDFDWGREKRRPVFGEGLVVVVNLEALGTNSGNVLKIISRPENRWVDFLLWVGIGRRRFSAVAL